MPEIEVRILDDGGNPKDPSRIRRLGPATFHVDPYHEPWLGLTHALARMECALTNGSGEAQEVSIEVDLDPDGTQSWKPRWDIEGRDHLYVEHGGRWWRVDGVVEGDVVKTRFVIPPGETRVCLSPAFGYGDYLRYLRSLPETRFLKKSLLTHSAQGREVWMLTLTDPDVPDEGKLQFVIDGRQHAYETFASFSVQGVIAFLLSGHPAANLSRAVYHIIPMVNPDGVYNGWMYQAPEGDPVVPRINALRQQELFPHVSVAMHNWIHRRHEDIRYRHVDAEGNQLVEVWHLFKGFMPAESEYGRAYVVDEDGRGCHRRTPPSPEYLRARGHDPHGWVCELPWFGRDDVDPVQRAKETGVKFINAVIQTEMRLFAVPGAHLIPPYTTTYLSNLAWADAGPRTFNFPPRTPRRDRSTFGTLISLQRVPYDRGLSLVPDMSATYALPEGADYFEAMVGVDDRSGAPDEVPPVVFVVRPDGREAWRSAPLVPGVRQRVSVGVAGARHLEIASLFHWDAAGSKPARPPMVSADWADAKLIRGRPILNLLKDAGVSL